MLEKYCITAYYKTASTDADTQGCVVQPMRTGEFSVTSTEGISPLSAFSVSKPY